MIEILKQAGADAHLMYEDGNTIIRLLFEHGGILEPFAQLPAFDTEARDDGGRKLLLAASVAVLRDRHGQAASPSYLALRQSPLHHKASLEAVDLEGRNALHALISALCSVHNQASQQTFAELASPLIPKLLSGIANQGRQPLHYVASSGRVDILDLLLEHGADPYRPDPLDNSIALHHLAKNMARKPAACTPRGWANPYLQANDKRSSL